MKDRSGILLLLSGMLLILGNAVFPFSENTGGRSGQPGQLAVANVPAEQNQMGRTRSGPGGSLQIAGSSSMESYVSALAEGFMERYPDITVILQFPGSSAGIASAAEGSADIGLSSRYLKEDEKALGLTEFVAGFDGIALCGNTANGVSGLTREALSDIYTGKIRNWTELGGCDLPVVVIGREAGSGTREAFEGLLGLEEQCCYANELDSTGAVMARVLATPGAIGYVSFETVGRMQKEEMPQQKAENAEAGETAVNESRPVDVLCLDGTAPSLENIRNGSYLLFRPFVMVVRGPVSSQNGLVQLWIDYVSSEEGHKIAEMTGISILF